MFSLDKKYGDIKGEPIGFFEGGKHDGKILYAYKGRKNKDLYVEVDISEEGEKPKIKPIHNVGANDVIYFCGSSGAGKSTMLNQYVKSYKAQYPKRKTYIISREDYEDDPALKDLKMIQIDMDEPLDFIGEDLSECLFVFDDVLNLINKEKQKNINELIVDLLENARKRDISIYLTSHIINPDNKMARVILNEIKKLVVFPANASKHQLTYALTKYFNISKKKIDKVINSDSRYVIISRICPNYCLEEQKAYICNDDDCV